MGEWQGDVIKVVILESNDSLCAALAAVLSLDSEMEVVGFATSVAGAVDELNRLKPHVLIMNDSWNDELTAAAANVGAEAILYSSQLDDDTILAALSAGVGGYVLKGTGGKLLLDAVRAAATGASCMDPAVASRAMRLLAAPRKRVRSKGDRASRTVLSERELEILSLVCQGLGNDGIAKVLLITPETVKTHLRRIMKKLEVTSRTEAAVHGIKNGLVKFIAH